MRLCIEVEMGSYINGQMNGLINLNTLFPFLRFTFLDNYVSVSNLIPLFKLNVITCYF